jgi:hypothetical protein
MAATVPRSLWLLLALTFLLPRARADDSADIHVVVGAVATALSSGDPALAISPFSKKCPDYDTLNNDFQALTGAYSLVSQISFTDEQVTAPAATVTVHWALTLSTRQTGFSTTRNEVVLIKL